MTHGGLPEDDRLEKPGAVIEMATPVAEAFLVLKARFKIDNYFYLNLSQIDPDPNEFFTVQSVAALTMRRLQSLWLVSQSSNITRTNTLIGLVQQTFSQFELLEAHCDNQEKRVIENAKSALKLAFEQVTDLLAEHRDALGGKVDVELGPTVVPNDPRLVDPRPTRFRRRK